MSAADFETAVQRLITQVGHWEAGRWNAPATTGATPATTSGATPGALTGAVTRAEAVRSLVQHLADQAADAEQRRHRPVPHLADTVLPDQLRVMADDLRAANPPPETLTAATEAVTQTRTHL